MDSSLGPDFRKRLEVSNNSSSYLETPVGDHNDKTPKIQLCLELREKIGKRKRKEFQLEVVVMKLKNIITQQQQQEQQEISKKNNPGPIPSPSPKPSSNPKKPKDSTTIMNNSDPLFVKLSFDEGKQLNITELKKQDLYENCNTIIFAEPFTFPIPTNSATSASIISTENNNYSSLLAKKSLLVEVCDKKLTRSARRFGSVEIQLDEIQLQLGKPIVQWYHL